MSLTEVPNVQVNERPIDAQAIASEMQYHQADSRREAMVKATRALIINEVVRQQAVSQGLWQQDQELTPQDEYTLIEKLLEHEGRQPSASETECRHYFEANRNKFSTAPLLEVRHILLASEAQDTQGRQQGREVAGQLLEQLHQGSDFASLAKRHSDCPSAGQGGNLGQISQGQTVPEFERQLFAAPEGLMALPIESRYGFHVVDVVRREEGHLLDYDMVKASIAEYLNTKVKRKHIAQYIEHLLGEAEIRGFDFALESSPLMQ